MKSLAEHRTLFSLVLVATLACACIAVDHVLSQRMSEDAAYQSVFCSMLESNEEQVSRHVLIYLDVHACLICTEDMAMWRELENRLAECGCTFSIWAPVSDSLDVAVAMQMEGLKTEIQALDATAVDMLGWHDIATPLKIILDSLCCPVDIIEAGGNVRRSRQALQRIMAQACLGE